MVVALVKVLCKHHEDSAETCPSRLIHPIFHRFGEYQ
jgi:hypothetical protein